MTIFNANYDTIQLAKNCLRDGGLVAFPTETVYGLGADAKNPDAVKRIFLAKNRPENHPLIVHVASFQQFDLWAQDIPDTALKLATHFFPAPLALILKKHPNVNSVVTGGQNTIALRVPNHPIALELLHAFDGGIAAPSANRYCRISPTQAQHVAEELGESVDMILNGGACKIGVESTIIDLSGDKPMLLRFGQITRHELEKVLQTEIFIPNSLLKTTIRTSGMMATHYAPTTISMRCETNFLPILVLENADKKIGDVVVSFITTNDITGGNSGSPVLDANGNLIGLAFDGNYEALSHKIAFDSELNRTICVDVRYVLWCIDKLGGAKHIVDELKLVQ